MNDPIYSPACKYICQRRKIFTISSYYPISLEDSRLDVRICAEAEAWVSSYPGIRLYYQKGQWYPLAALMIFRRSQARVAPNDTRVRTEQSGSFDIVHSLGITAISYVSETLGIWGTTRACLYLRGLDTDLFERSCSRGNF